MQKFKTQTECFIFLWNSNNTGQFEFYLLIASIFYSYRVSLKGEVPSKVNISNLGLKQCYESKTNIYQRFYAVISPLFTSQSCFLTAAILPGKRTGASVAV